MATVALTIRVSMFSAPKAEKARLAREDLIARGWQCLEFDVLFGIKSSVFSEALTELGVEHLRVRTRTRWRESKGSAAKRKVQAFTDSAGRAVWLRGPYYTLCYCLLSRLVELYDPIGTVPDNYLLDCLRATVARVTPEILDALPEAYALGGYCAVSDILGDWEFLPPMRDP